jgi:hypothetical protein
MLFDPNDDDKGWRESGITREELFRELDNATRRVFGWPEIPPPSKCGCRGIVHTCNTVN